MSTHSARSFADEHATLPLPLVCGFTQCGSTSFGVLLLRRGQVKCDWCGHVFDLEGRLRLDRARYGRPSVLEPVQMPKWWRRMWRAVGL